jgi:hypothetical protein
MCLINASSEGLLLLAGLFLCLLRFLSHVALRSPVGSTQVDIDVHHNLKIDTAHFKQGFGAGALATLRYLLLEALS